ncbi:MAG: endonuclease [Anaerolineae bacterium]|nr:endonuclease [Anaerolineae bacterium]
MDRLEQVLKGTEERYTQRTPEREQTLETLAEGALLAADTPARVDMRLDRLGLDRPSAAMVLEGGMGFGSLPPTIPEHELDRLTLERIIEAEDLMSINFLELGLLVARTVGRVHIYEPSGRRAGYGTGFMVSPRLLLTNNHVLPDALTASCAQIEFNYQVGLDGKPLPTVFFRLVPGEFFLTDPTLDYALVAVSPRRVGGQDPLAFGWNRLIEQQGKVIKGEYLNIIQHPDGKPKQLVLRENQLIDVLDDFLHYRTDTRPGSSGSPVLNDQWELVALHHSGVPQRDDEGQILTRSGARWRSWMGEHAIAWIANEGARISRIVKHIQRQALSPDQKRLRAEMFEAEPPRALVAMPAVSVGTAPQEPRPTEGTGAATLTLGEDGSATWSIPLQVTVRMGAPTVPTAPPPSGAEQPAIAPPTAPPEDRELSEALAALAEAQEREYYDEESDLAAREAYYAGLALTEAPAENYALLSTLVQETHANCPRYSPRRYVYPWVDLQPDLTVASIYSGLTYDPEDFIREDFAISQERALEVQELLLSESTFGVESLTTELDLLEARLPYNCEHVVPQSWFGKREPMRGDLHHLFACESGCNSFRGNRAYFDFPDYEEALRDQCGKLLENRFEPASGKGAIARATLYFLLRYPREINDSEGEFGQERLSTLLEWHEQYPVTLYEKHRNAAIFEEQGNRNPLIDFPEWTSRIDFTLGLG